MYVERTPSAAKVVMTLAMLINAAGIRYRAFLRLTPDNTDFV